MYKVSAKSEKVTCGTYKTFVKLARNDPYTPFPQFVGLQIPKKTGLRRRLCFLMRTLIVITSVLKGFVLKKWLVLINWFWEMVDQQEYVKPCFRSKSSSEIFPLQTSYTIRAAYEHAHNPQNLSLPAYIPISRLISRIQMGM